MQTMRFGLLPKESMRQPDESTANEPVYPAGAASLLSPQALTPIYAAIAASVAFGLLVELFLDGAHLASPLWPIGSSLASAGLALWIALNAPRARAAHRVGFVLMLCLSQVCWASSLGPGQLPSGLILLPIVAGAWASVTDRPRVLPLHLVIMLCTLFAVGIMAGVLPGGAAYGTRASGEWIYLLLALVLCVFCGTAVNRALRSQLRQVQSASRALQASEDASQGYRQFLQAVIDTSPYGIAAIELDTGRATLVNAAFEQLLGFRREELAQRNISEQLQLEGGARHLVRQTRASGLLLNLSLPVSNRAGERRIVRGGGSIFSLHGKEYYVWVARDVTDERLIQTERDAIFAASPIGIFTERDGLIRVISAELERWMGWPTGSGALRPVADLVGGDNALREMRSRCDADLRAGRSASIEWPMFHNDGSPFTARFIGRLTGPDGLGLANDTASAVWIV